MRIIALIIMLSYGCVQAQSLSVSTTSDTTYCLTTDSLHKFYGLAVHNNTGNSLTVMATKQEISMTPGTANGYCWGSCLPPGTADDPVGLLIEPFDQLNAFEGDYFPQGTPGPTTVRYCFHPDTDSTDTACIDITYIAILPNNVSDLSDLGARVYPNPTNNILILDFDSPQPDIQIDLISMDARHIQSRHFSGSLFRLDVSSLATGSYIIRVLSGQQVYIQRFIKT